MSKLARRYVLVAVAAAAALAASAAALGAPPTVTVALGKPTEFGIAAAPKAVPKGTVILKVTNRGGISHDFRIAGKKTPRLAPGKTATLKVTFTKAGKYAFLCTLPSHAVAGMKGTLTVK